jgi:hypothetical protein
MTRAPRSYRCLRSKGHASFAKAACASNKDSFFGLGNKLVLKNGVVIIGQFRHSFGEGRKFDE